MKSCEKYGKWLVSILLWCIVLVPCNTMAGPEMSTASYEETVTQWTSYRDVANWMSKNFQYEYGRKVSGWQPRNPEQTFKLRTGMCQDGANFALHALNRINPDYHARIVFIKNRVGPPHHWVTAFTMDGKLYIIDYGAGARWASMMGVHGPYNSLTEYENFLSSLQMSGFKVQDVSFQ